MLVVMRLHVDLFAELPGKLFLGLMGLLMAAAIVSGVVLYWPFTRRLDFGTLRANKAKRVGWLDWHNLLGAVTIVWALVVSVTGTINTLADPMLRAWKANELAAMSAAYAGQPTPAKLASLDGVVANARAAAPGMEVQFIAFPGTPFTSQHHFAAFMRGDTALTARLYKPILLDGETGVFSASAELPVYLKALLVSQPLHFGDYGGMPLKILWAICDIMTIVVLASGLYLWGGSAANFGAAPALQRACETSRMALRRNNVVRVYGAPLVIGVCTAFGLVAALMWEPIGRYVSWFALALPPAAVLWGLMRKPR